MTSKEQAMASQSTIDGNVARCIGAIAVSATYFSKFGNNTQDAETYSEFAARQAAGAAYMVFCLHPELRESVSA